MALQHLSLRIDDSLAGQRIDRSIATLCSLPREQITGLFHHDCVQRNGVVCREPFARLELSDLVELRFDPARRYHEKKQPPKNLGFEIIFEDDAVIVVNKPPALLTVPSPYGETNTLIHKISAYLRHSGGKAREAFVAHRLDRGVSGLLVFGKSLAISMRLRDQFELRKPQREYLAIVAGNLGSHEGTFRSYLATDDNLTRYSTDDAEGGQLAITHFRVVQTLPNATLVQIWLETGRRNQIRVHFAEAGHPVLGDPRYHPQLATHVHWKTKRIALHARSLGFQHPVTEEMYRFECPLPKEFLDFLRGGKERPRRR